MLAIRANRLDNDLAHQSESAEVAQSAKIKVNEMRSMAGWGKADSWAP